MSFKLQIEIPDAQQWIKLGMAAHDAETTLSNYVYSVITGQPQEKIINEKHTEVIEVDLEESEWVEMITNAHKQEITLNQYMCNIIETYIDHYEKSLSSDEGKQDIDKLGENSVAGS